MKQRTHFLAIFTSFCLAVPIFAQDADVEVLKVAAYDELTIRLEDEIRETISDENTIYLSLLVKVSPKWAEDIDRIKVKDRDIVIETSQGESSPQIGTFRSGLFSKQLPSNFTIWKNKGEGTLAAVFAIPADAKKTTLKIGTYSVDIEIPGVTPFPAYSDFVRVEVTGARIVEKITATFQQGDFVTQTTIRNPFAKLLEVDLNLTPLKSNEKDYTNRFYWTTPHIGLSTPDGYFHSAIGEISLNGFMPVVQHSELLREGKDEWETQEQTLYFPVPQTVSSFKLYYYMETVAEGKIQ